MRSGSKDFCSAALSTTMVIGARTTRYLLGFPATLFLNTVLWALRGLMHGVENLSVPGLGATSQNILWSTTKVNEACARMIWCSAHTRHVTKVRLSTDSPHRVVIPYITPEYQYPWFRFYCASLFPACWMLHHLLTWRPLQGCQRLSHHRPQARQPSPSPRHRRRQTCLLPRGSTSQPPPVRDEGICAQGW
jgi:hypothetical protein